MDRPGGRLPEDAVDRDQLLTNVSVYWFTGTGASAANFLYEAAHATASGCAPVRRRRRGGPCSPPTRSSAGSSIPSRQIAHWSEFERGGHFAAMEAPDLLVDDVRAFFRASAERVAKDQPKDQPKGRQDSTLMR